MIKQSLATKRGDATVSGDDATVVAPNRGVVGRLDQLAQWLDVTSRTDQARLFGVSVQALSKWRRGEAAPFRSTLAKISERTGASVDWLESGEGPMMNAKAAEARVREASEHPRDLPQQLARLQDQVALDDLVVAFESAQRQFAARGVTAPEPRKLLALTLALYDAAMQTLAEEPPPAAGSDVAGKA